ncbi:Plant basic secretory protein (BSP) family protein [Abeliophyllum distichum]|uniref:Plant basic secretory protein (BSP) family protein n=1 Tax=Abeliophyllum distichum TaxID=126358 RepID=A0ABD1P9E2_9LAMI
MNSQLFILFSLLLVLAYLPAGIFGVQYEIINQAQKTPGGARFEREIGIEYTQKIMKTINNFIWDTFKQYTEADRKNVQVVKLFVQEYKGAEAITSGENIMVSSVYLEGYQGNLTWEFTSLLYHEMTHVFQWNGAGSAPVGLVEGVADYMILTSNYYPAGFAKPGQGEKWDQGYDFTARFLEYCEGLRLGFVAELNKKMISNYSDNYFFELLGKPVGQLWNGYKAIHGNI